MFFEYISDLKIVAIDNWKPEKKLPSIEFEIDAKNLLTNKFGEIKIMKCAGETVQLKNIEKPDICVGNNGSLISIKLNAGHNMRIIPINHKGGKLSTYMEAWRQFLM